MDELLLQLEDIVTSVEILDGHSIDTTIKHKLEQIMGIIESVKDELNKFERSIEVAKHLLDQHTVLFNHFDTMLAWIGHLKANKPPGLLLNNENNCSNLNTLAVPVQTYRLSPQSNQSMSPIEQSNNSFSMNSCISCSTKKYNETLDVTRKYNTPKPVNNLTVSIGYIPNQEFDNVPQYMKGRLRVTDLNGFINIYNSVLNKKYSILKKAKTTLKNKKDLDYWCVWKAQAKTAELAGQYFCTENDFSSQEGLKVGKRELLLLTILRHVKRIREIRTKDAVYYVACM